mmetsp:Transcript_31641/g.75182  ORF Transcript_31641/g.75182 Transcript_31641/m.75182 type:complete len:251 (+) Transcript_31641:511-1263(+)
MQPPLQAECHPGEGMVLLREPTPRRPPRAPVNLRPGDTRPLHLQRLPPRAEVPPQGSAEVSRRVLLVRLGPLLRVPGGPDPPRLHPGILSREALGCRGGLPARRGLCAGDAAELRRGPDTPGARPDDPHAQLPDKVHQHLRRAHAKQQPWALRVASQLRTDPQGLCLWGSDPSRHPREQLGRAPRPVLPQHLERPAPRPATARPRTAHLHGLQPGADAVAAAQRHGQGAREAHVHAEPRGAADWHARDFV